MLGFYQRALLGGAVFALAACNAPVAPPAAAEAIRQAPPHELLSHLVERHWDESAAASPWYSWGGAETRYTQAPADRISPQALADSLAIERRFLADLLAIPRATLDPGATTTYDIFLRERQLTIESFTYPMELLPVNPYDGIPQEFALMAAAAERQALSSAKDFDNWRTRAANFAGWTDQAIANMREGLRRGYTLPRVLVERTLPLLAALGADDPTNVFHQALQAGPETPADAERTRAALAVSTVVERSILPSYRALHEFLQREYLPRARDSVGLSALPLGEAWYGYLVKRATGSSPTPAELHALGVAETERLRARLQALLAGTAAAGNAQNFVDAMSREPRFSYKTPEELLSAYQDLKAQAGAATPALFAAVPRADFEIRSVEAFRAADAAALSYRRSMAFGKNPAVLYVDTADLTLRPAAASMPMLLREAVPGHHYQISLQQERVDLPRFRRFGGNPAFIQGWGLYAASLGEELGLYRDTEAKFAALLAQLQCAAGLVIDTGLHSQQWTRQRALDYLHAQLPIDDVAAANVVDREIALPGEALACTVGYLKLQGLRLRAQQTLGGRFDLRAFHDEVLQNGAVPLDLLEAHIQQWMDAVLAAPPKLD